MIFAAGAAAGFWGRGVYDTLTAPAPPAVGDHFRAAVTGVYDADTMTVRRSGDDNYKIRVWGIDAPERSQRCTRGTQTVTCGLMARDAFRKLVLGRDVSCEIKAIDKNYGRLVAQCLIDGKDPVETLVQNGWALSDTQYSNDPYAAQQAAAQRSKNGIWGMDFLPPREWRACKSYGRGGATAPAVCRKPLGPL